MLLLDLVLVLQLWLCSALAAENKILASLRTEPIKPLVLQLRHIVQHDLSHDPIQGHPQKDQLRVMDFSNTAYSKELADLRPARFMLIGKGTTTPKIGRHGQSLERMQLLQAGQGSKVLPNTTDKETIVNLAKMTSDAYLFDPREPGWLNTSLGFNFTRHFGWKDDGLRAHVFTTEDESIVIVAYKGTSINPRDKLSGRDRINDVKLFSCCCGAQNPYHYSPICNCSTGYYTCDSLCATSELLQNDTYYNAAVVVMQKMKLAYPDATFWTTGHSLGGSLASLVGLTFDIPTVTFEAPPERLPAERMGLIHANNPVAYHFGHTADPIYLGACNGYFSSCSFGGFSFESQCFTGKRCQYETVRDKGWHVSIANHRINYVIENVLKAYDTVPDCESDEDTDCQDCFNWKFS